MNLFCWLGTLNGGMEQRNLAIVKKLQERDVDVTLGLFKKEPELDFKQEIIPRKFPTGKLLGWNHYFSERKILGLEGGFDSYFCKFLKYKPDKFWFFRISGDITKTRQANFLGRLAYYPLLKKNLKCLKKADSVISCSSESEKLLETLGTQKVIKSRNFIDTSVFRPGKKEHHNKLRVVFVGRDDPIKNFNNLKIACDALPDVELRTFGINNWVGKDVLAEEFQQADLVVLPSYYESYGITALEAMACNSPVLVSHGVTISKTELAPYMYVCDTSSQSLMCNIRNILDNDDRFKFASEGGCFVRDNYEKNKVLNYECEELMKAYEQHSIIHY